MANDSLHTGGGQKKKKKKKGLPSFFSLFSFFSLCLLLFSFLFLCLHYCVGFVALFVCTFVYLYFVGFVALFVCTFVNLHFIGFVALFVCTLLICILLALLLCLFAFC